MAVDSEIVGRGEVEAVIWGETRLRREGVCCVIGCSFDLEEKKPARRPFDCEGRRSFSECGIADAEKGFESFRGIAEGLCCLCAETDSRGGT
jgi:hypothetical protein